MYNIDLATEEAGQLWAWNGTVPSSMDRCIHELFAEQASTQPYAPAICL
jgi:hypothetical protein